MTSISLTMLDTRRRRVVRRADDSTPRVVALDRTGHAARSPATTHELGALEGDDGTFVLPNTTVAGEEVHPLYHAEAGTFHLAQRPDVPRVREHESRSHR